MFLRSPSGTSSASVAACFVTGSLSPVRDASGDAQRGCAEQSAVGADGVAFAQHEDVAAHQFPRGHRVKVAVTQHRRCRRGHRLQCGDRRFGSAFLDETEDAVKQDNGRDDQGVDRQAGRALGQPCGDRDRNRHQQEVDERILELRQDLPPERHRWFGPQLVGPIALQTAFGFGRCEPRCGLYAQIARDVERVPSRRIQ